LPFSTSLPRVTFSTSFKADYADFKSQPSSARRALNCIITAYHLHEWVWGDWLKADYATWKKLGIRDRNSFQAWLDSSWPGFGVLKDLTNGAKHIRKTYVDTERIAGYGSGPYGMALHRMGNHVSHRLRCRC
jgi:hypothetical protein